jgi:hypothetical protein
MGASLEWGVPENGSPPVIPREITRGSTEPRVTPQIVAAVAHSNKSAAGHTVSEETKSPGTSKPMSLSVEPPTPAANAMTTQVAQPPVNEPAASS